MLIPKLATIENDRLKIWRIHDSFIQLHSCERCFKFFLTPLLGDLFGIFFIIRFETNFKDLVCAEKHWYSSLTSNTPGLKVDSSFRLVFMMNDLGKKNISDHPS